MATIQKFEDLICWQESRVLANLIFDVTDRIIFRDYDLKRQIRRAAISPISNIAEGFNRGTRNELIDAFFIAKGEIGEVRSQAYIAYDRKYINQTDLENILKQTDVCARLVQSFVSKVRMKSHKGLQFKTTA